jgi:hypothetical protein
MAPALRTPGRCWRVSELSVRPGPTSRAWRAGRASARRTPSAKRTVLRRCATQYSGSVASASVIHVPVRLDRNGSDGCAARCCAGRRGTRRGSAPGASARRWRCDALHLDLVLAQPRRERLQRLRPGRRRRRARAGVEIVARSRSSGRRLRHLQPAAAR